MLETEKTRHLLLPVRLPDFLEKGSRGRQQIAVLVVVAPPQDITQLILRSNNLYSRLLRRKKVFTVSGFS
jgi:hypothetical protein